MRRKLQQFMYGRYGVDELSRFLLGVCIVCILLNLFTRNSFFYLIDLTLLIICYMRMLSRNFAKRRAENDRYLAWSYKIRNTSWLKNISTSWRKTVRRIAQSKDFHIYKCPTCGQKIRIPRGKGMIRITCPKCRCQFDKKS